MTGKAPVKFELPEIAENRQGWGPCFIPEKFADMPYQPFSKSDRIGKVHLLDFHRLTPIQRTRCCGQAMIGKLGIRSKISSQCRRDECCAGYQRRTAYGPYACGCRSSADRAVNIECFADISSTVLRVISLPRSGVIDLGTSEALRMLS